MAKEEASPTKVQETATVPPTETDKDLKCELKSKIETPAAEIKSNGAESVADEKSESTNGEKISSESTNGKEANGDAKEVNGTEESEKKVEEKYHESPTKNEAYILLAQGKRHYLVKDYASAVATLGDCCAKFSEIFGELADECGDVYFSYGKALLELAREESGVLGPAIEKDKEESGEDEEEEEEDGAEGDEEDSEKDAEKDGKDASKDTKNDAEMDTSADAKKDAEEKPEEGKEGTSKETVENGESAKEGGAEGEDVEKEVEEDATNLQIAWEMLELAKTIYERQKSDEKLADTLLKLGEVSLETENYEQAIEDMSKSLDLQQKILSADDRGVAETYFQLGVACSLANFHDRSISYFKKAKEVLQLRIKNLKGKTEPDEKDKVNAFYSLDGEIKEIESIIPEIDEKIADMEDFKAETLRAISASIIPSKAKEGESSSSSSCKPAMDISHLIRKKRKPEEEAEGSECKIKKAAPEVTETEKKEGESKSEPVSTDAEMKEVGSNSA
ncbi:unnamed protein product [Bemisia tabaci]|uniref:Tetratricopeptide SHNi-TPR domain-containing protein n=1 Tax=Bemisia tabaci TaxID=7038 RepID=A0A9P0CGG3_BEMTA|nr:PREDICTED: protein HGV2 [Bemisia tabaci]CAH0773609.1 unnamed protein product [Bemisia tabaci]